MLKRLMLTAAVVVLGFSSAQAEDFQAGTHYRVLPEKLPTSYRGDEAGEIQEIFSYSCIHCYNLEPFVQTWIQSKPDDIRFTHVPVLFNDRQLPEARAYYATQFLDIADATHMPIFNEIHLNRHRLGTDEGFADFISQFGVSKDDYLEMADSFAVNARINQARVITQKSGLSGTPSLVVNGRYLIDGRMAGSNQRMFEVAEWLVRNDPAQ